MLSRLSLDGLSIGRLIYVSSEPGSQTSSDLHDQPRK